MSGLVERDLWVENLLDQFGELQEDVAILERAAVTSTAEGNDDYVVYNVKDYGAMGDGFTDDTTAIQNTISALDNGPGVIYVPVGIYMVTAPIVIRGGQRLVGEAFQDNSVGAVITADSGFSGAAVIKSYSWDNGDWLHWGAIEDLRIDCDGNAAAGVAIHQLGEASLLKRVFVADATDSGFLLTGAHAVAALEECSAFSCTNYGFKFYQHPSLGSPDNTNAGTITMLVPSGDNNTGAHIYLDGAQRLTIIGLKSEGHTKGIHVAGSGTGGAAARVVLIGGLQDMAANGDAVYISGTARPIILAIGHYHNQTGTGVYINDTVLTKTLPAGGLTNGYGIVTYGGSNLNAGEFVMDKEMQIKWRRADNGTLYPVLWQPSDLSVRLRAVHATGIYIQDSAGTTIITVGATAGLTLGQSGGKVGFYNTTPVVQQTAPAVLTDSTGGATNDGLVAISGSGDDSNINDNFAELAQDLAAIRTALVNQGLIA